MLHTPLITSCAKVVLEAINGPLDLSGRSRFAGLESNFRAPQQFEAVSVGPDLPGDSSTLLLLFATEAWRLDDFSSWLLEVGDMPRLIGNGTWK